MTLSVSRISKNFGSHRALNDVSFELAQGESAILVGPNGSGKSTLLRTICSLLRADRGSICFGGQKFSNLSRGALSYLGHNLQLYGSLSARENLLFRSRLIRLDFDIERYLNNWKLEAVANMPLVNLSKGSAQRVALATALLGKPRFVLLDEPSAALDLSALDLFKRSLEELRREVPDVIILSATHDIARLDLCASRILVLKNGELSASLESGSTRPFRSEEILSVYNQKVL